MANDHALPSVVLTIVGCVMLAMLGSTANAFNNISSAVQTDLGLSQLFMNVVASFGLLGVNLNFVFGKMRDRLGSAWTGLAGAMIGGLGYVVMAATRSKSDAWMLVVGLFLVGFGNGGAFLAALSLALTVSPTGAGISVAVVATAMAFAISITVYIQTLYADMSHCKQDSCWRRWTVVLGLACFSVQGLGALLIFACFRPRNYDHLAPGPKADSSPLLAPVNHTTETETQPLLEAQPTAAVGDADKPSPSVVGAELSFVKALRIFKHPYFLMLFLVEFIVFVAAVTFLSQASQMWSSFTKDASSGKSLGNNLLPAFSYWNAAASMGIGAFSGVLKRTRWCRLQSFLAGLIVAHAAIFAALGLMAHMYRHGALAPRGAQIAFYLGSSSVGFVFGALLVLYPTIVGTEFGFANFGTFFGLLNAAPSIASFITAPIVGAVYSARGSYDLVLLAIALMLLVSAAMLQLVRNRWPFPVPA